MRTAIQSYKKVLKELDCGRLGAHNGEQCVYERKTGDVVRHCGVGALFNEAQIADLKSRRLNTKAIEDVIDVIGIRNLTAVTGLDADELDELQSEHDMNEYFVRTDPLNCDFRRFIVQKIDSLR